MINMSMGESVFIDTWAWLALSNRKDAHYKLAKKEYEEIYFFHRFNLVCPDARISDK